VLQQRLSLSLESPILFNRWRYCWVISIAVINFGINRILTFRAGFWRRNGLAWNAGLDPIAG